ncbi:MAG: D-hexose-6-phosphate mutarotase [Verrucomicrobia bacterium]|nr:D-hexose-6-phosphate mutarotase [Verrucomicrobiota bacterium]
MNAHPMPSDIDLPPGVRLEACPEPMVRLVVETPLASGHLYLHGAHVAHFQPAGHHQTLFMSARSQWARHKPIRGGIPLCLPWFGANPADPSAPMHGIARLTEWSLVSATANAAGEIVATLAMDSATNPPYPCPHPFKAIFTAVFGTTLTVSLEIENTGADTMPVSEALHTYLTVGDVRQVSIRGLAGCSFFDRLDDARTKTEGEAPITITGETDRVYLDTDADVVVSDPSLGREITVSKRGSASTVVWNPWIAKAAAMPDFGDDEWPGMLCIETANALGNAYQLAPGAKHTITTTLACGKL